jgi:4-amino-4-deoxy-L-arabinose transferase-like glycosyltransferase
MTPGSQRLLGRPAAPWIGGLLLAGVLLLVGIGVAPLIDRDEPAYAEAAREMLARGDWVATWYNGQPWFDKPPLVYWSEMVAYSALGVNETAARLPVALFGIAGLMAVYWAGRRLRGPRAGALAAAVLAASLLYLGLSRVAMLDVPFTACVALAMGALIAGLQEPQRARWPLLAGVALGLAILAKSPAAVVLFAGVLVVAGVTERAPLRLRGLRWLLAAVTCLAVAAPWYLAMTRRFGIEFLREFLVAGNFGRFVEAEHTRSATPFYYLPIIVVGFLPWTAMLPGALRNAWRQRRREAVPLIWAVLTVVFFSAAQSKLAGYIMPAFPALALIVAFDLDRAWDDRSSRAARRGLYWAAGSTLVVAAALLAFALARAPEYAYASALAVCLAAVPLVLATARAGRVRIAVAAGAAVCAAAAVVLGYGLLPAAARERTARGLAERIRADGRPHRIYLVNIAPLHLPSLLFYARQSVSRAEPGQALAARPGDAFVVEGNALAEHGHAPGLRPVYSQGPLTLWMMPAPPQPRRPGRR